MWILVLSLIQCSDTKCSTKEVAHTAYPNRSECMRAGKELKETFEVLYTKVNIRCEKD